jgi:hypothetical protein
MPDRATCGSEGMPILQVTGGTGNNRAYSVAPESGPRVSGRSSRTGPD